MRCKIHPYEDGVGVCASCLRERLFALLAAGDGEAERTRENHCSRRKPDPNPPPPPRLEFPRSVSPYLSHRRSADDAPAACAHPRRLFGTPQVGPSFASPAGGVSGDPVAGGIRKFSILASLFGKSRSEEIVPKSGASRGSKSSSWISVLTRRKKESQTPAAAAEEGWSGRVRRPCRRRDRGMSPATGEDSASKSVYGTESWPSPSGGWWRPTPSPARRATVAPNHHGQPFASFAMCLSPLVRASPSHWRNQAPDVGFSGDIRRPRHNRHDSAGADAGAFLCPNRSRKLVDFGRFR